jgi:CHAT domain-containing protein
MHVFTIPAGRDALIGLLRAFRNEVAVGRRGLNDPSSIRTAVEHGKRLYDLLVGPVQGLVGQARRILICPDGPLHALPFAALVSRADPAPRYLVEDKPLHTIVSMTVYAETRNLLGAKDRREARLLAFGDPLYQKSQKEAAAGGSRAAPSTSQEFGLAPLQGSGQEVEAISNLFGVAATVRRGPGATEAAARQESKDYTILHFAVHGLFNERVGLDSFLALSQPAALGRPPTKDDNGLWQAWEILERGRLDADLVVLSACETGRGQDIRGEGLVGLTRAFQYAGARSIVVSLWNVNDVSTATFMTVFYRELRGGAAKDVALQKAMVTVLSDQRWRHPFYWSPFVLVGAWQ